MKLEKKSPSIWRPYTRIQDTEKTQWVSKAEGSFLHLNTGQKILDGISSWWVITHGHCHPQIVEAIQQQSSQVDQVVFAQFTHQPAEELVELLSSLLPSSLNRVFFSDNGSTAVEVALKMAYQYWQQRGHPRKKKFLAFQKAFHGDTCGAMSVTADGTFTQAYSELRFEVIRCQQGHFLSDSLELWLQDFYEKIAQHSESLAGVILEPFVQGAGGMIIWPTEVVQKISQICNEQKILLLFDEVMTGFGRTGTLFAFERLKITPDFLCLSKGLTGGSLPLALTLTRKEIQEAFSSPERDKLFFHGHSFTGNAISCAAAVANLKLFQKNWDPHLAQKITQIETTHRTCMAHLAKKIPLKDQRVLGSLGVIELEAQHEYGGSFATAIASHCLEKGLFIRPLGNVFYLMPPYCTTLEELQTAWEILQIVLTSFS